MILAILAVIRIWGVAETICVAEESEEFCGTWVNSNYNTTFIHAKVIFNRYGTWSAYLMDSDPDPSQYGKFTITDKWTDPDGNIWLKERYYFMSR